jgi:hypothetical protein
MPSFTGSILALDLGATAGWALGAPGAAVRYGTVQLAKPGASNGAIGSAFGEWLGGFLAVSKPALLIFEAPLAPQAQRSPATARLLLGLAWQVEALAFDHQIFRVYEATVQEVRKFFIGAGRLKAEDADFQIRRKCKAFGWQTADSHAADALALWSYQCAIVAPGTELQRHAGVGL